MLDEKDLQAIAQLMAQQKKEIIGELGTRMDQKLADQKKEVMGEVAALMEAHFDPKFDLLAEGQKTLLETLAPKNRVDQLEEEVDFLKTVIRSLSHDVAELKKAQ